MFKSRLLLPLKMYPPAIIMATDNAIINGILFFASIKFYLWDVYFLFRGCLFFYDFLFLLDFGFKGHPNFFL